MRKILNDRGLGRFVKLLLSFTKSFFIHLRWRREWLQDCLHAHCSAWKTEITRREFCSMLNLFLSDKNKSTDIIYCAFYQVDVSLLTTALVSMQVIYITIIIFYRTFVAAATTSLHKLHVSLISKCCLQVENICSDCSKVYVWVTLWQLDGEMAYLHIDSHVFVLIRNWGVCLART